MSMVLAMFGAVFTAAPASAAEVDGVTSVDIVNPPPYVTEQQYQVNATWAVPDSAQPGDTFTLNFPDALVGFGATIDLPDADGNIVGTCVVTNSQFVCTLSDFVLTHNNVHGTLHFNAKFTESFDEEEITFETGNGSTIVTDVEGGVDDVDPELPQSPVKFGYVNNDGETMTWNIQVPSEDFGSDTNPIITDDYDAPIVFDPSRLTVRWIDKADWADRDDPSVWTYLGEGSGPDSYTLTDRPADTAFDVQLNQPLSDGSRLYEVSFIVDLPADVENGDVFNNRAVVNGSTYTATPVEYVGAGGGGEGDDLGDFEVTKTVVGSGAPAVEGAEYTVNYSYVDDGETITGSLTVAEGQIDGLTDLPAGAVVTLSEVLPAEEGGIVYGVPVFSGEGVTDNGDGTATFTVIDGLVEIGLENLAVQITGGLLVTKTVTGDAATAVAGAEYTVEYSYEANGETVTGSLTITDGSSDGFNDVPFGTVVTLSEVAPTGTGVTYDTPIFSGEGVTDNGDGTATVTIGEGMIEVGLENPVSMILGGFDVTKTVTGDGAPVVAGTDYTINYSYEVEGEPATGSLVIADGETDGLSGVPFGTVVTLSEVAPTGTGVTYGTPVFSGAGVTDNGDGTATFTIGEGTIEVGLENPVTVNLGGFAVTKTVTGDGAASVVDALYTVDFAFERNGETVTGSLVLANGDTVGLADVPEGTVVTLSEVAATAPGVTYGTPVFSGAGVTDNGDGTASFTVTGGVVEIGLENPVTLVPPTTTTSSLAITGADSTPLIILAALLLAAGATALVARRRSKA
jgi:LPXTG-motif cell wall-anchored protein